MVTVVRLVATLCEHRARYQVLLDAIVAHLSEPIRSDGAPISIELRSGVQPSQLRIFPSEKGTSGWIDWTCDGSTVSISYLWEDGRMLCSQVRAMGETLRFLRESFGKERGLKLLSHDFIARRFELILTTSEVGIF